MPHAEKSLEPEVHQRMHRGPAADHESSSRPTVQAVSGLAPRELAQRQRLQAAFGPAAQLQAEEDELLQGRFKATAQRAEMEEEEPLLQARSAGPLQREADPAPPNQTGMPDSLKAGVESLSGMDMSDVRVHRNSSQPAQLNALAYAQGSDIHLGPGQEQHLPHEAWHVVQQRQGRVQPTMQLAGTAVNDDAALESEADAMGDKALREGS